MKIVMPIYQVCNILSANLCLYILCTHFVLQKMQLFELTIRSEKWIWQVILSSLSTLHVTSSIDFFVSWVKNAQQFNSYQYSQLSWLPRPCMSLSWGLKPVYIIELGPGASLELVCPGMVVVGMNLVLSLVYCLLSCQDRPCYPCWEFMKCVGRHDTTGYRLLKNNNNRTKMTRPVDLALI